MQRRAALSIACVLSLARPVPAQVSGPGGGTPTTKIVFLGTGNPAPAPSTMGPSIAIVVNGTPYIVDAGVGVVRRAAEAGDKGVKGLEMPNLKTVFLTHLHSDHTLGLPDLINTPWIMGRTAPLTVYGPAGTAAMTKHLVEAWSADRDVRVKGLEKRSPTGSQVIAHEIKPGVVYKDANVTVTAFLVAHGSWDQAFGYRFDTPDRTIVISGDTSPTDSVVRACNGCDILIHEVYSQQGYDASPEDWRKYILAFHTSTHELAAIATKARPGLLILSHQMYFGRPKDNYDTLLEEMRQFYKGPVSSARDLDVY